MQMKTTLISILTALLVVSGVSLAELNGEITASNFDAIDRPSLGISGTVYPAFFRFNRFSIGLDFGMELIERHLMGHTPFRTDSSKIDPYGIEHADYLYLKYFTKEYRDFMFLPLGLNLRYEFGNGEDLASIRPALSLGVGGVFNVYQKSNRQISYWYQSLHILQNDPYNLYYDLRRAVDFGGETIGSFSLYLKPKVALYWHRFYLSYEYHIFSKYLLGSVSFGYIFRR